MPPCRAVYGWPVNLAGKELLARLLELNLARARSGCTPKAEARGNDQPRPTT
jgi:hypothetical protein